MGLSSRIKFDVDIRRIHYRIKLWASPLCLGENRRSSRHESVCISSRDAHIRYEFDVPFFLRQLRRGDCGSFRNRPRLHLLRGHRAARYRKEA